MEAGMEAIKKRIEELSRQWPLGRIFFLIVILGTFLSLTVFLAIWITFQFVYVFMSLMSGTFTAYIAGMITTALPLVAWKMLKPLGKIFQKEFPELTTGDDGSC